MQPETGPLHGYTVVELSTGIAGAYCTTLLADGGAHVIKVESPRGDPLRRWSASGADVEPGDDGARPDSAWTGRGVTIRRSPTSSRPRRW